MSLAAPRSSRSYPRRFTFSVADPVSSIRERVVTGLSRVEQRLLTKLEVSGRRCLRPRLPNEFRCRDL